MCEYCNGNKILEGEEHRGRSLCHIDNKDKKFVFEYGVSVFDRFGNVTVRYVKAEDFITIDFCPKCGRKL